MLTVNLSLHLRRGNELRYRTIGKPTCCEMTNTLVLDHQLSVAVFGAPSPHLRPRRRRFDQMVDDGHRTSDIAEVSSAKTPLSSSSRGV
ncbi:unnamed protein product [Soboliphyme baturini]|uniref:Uncharacterized protein n=1 Tax=Soboliphyme baturini TaxID=241478 RepID=A0A183IRJ0_9BILA|nr:unnamed protein product [Soboliphyme baturini]